jgi:hypothetical protein
MSSSFAAFLEASKNTKELQVYEDDHEMTDAQESLLRFMGMAVGIKLAVERFLELPEAGRLFLPKTLESDYHVPGIFFLPHTGAPPAIRFDSTLYYVLEMLSYQDLEEMHTLSTEKILSRWATDDKGDPVDLTSICQETEVLLRKAVLSENLIRLDPALRDLRETYRDYLLFLSNNPFDHCGACGDTSPTVLIRDLVRFTLVFGELFLVVHYDPIFKDPHFYRAFSHLMKIHREVAGIETDLRDSRSLIKMLALIETRARQVTRWLDDWGLALSHEPDVMISGDQVATETDGFSHLELQTIVEARNLNQLPQSFSKISMINGSPVVIEYQASLCMGKDYHRLTTEVAPHVTTLRDELTRIYSMCERTVIEECETTGEINPVDYYRAEADVRIFDNTLTRSEPDESFQLLVLVDNSCSINDNKKGMMARILTLVVNTAMDHADKFVHFAAYAQHSTGSRRVTLRRLIDSPTCRLTNPASILHLVSSGVNYDAYAAHELVTTHVRPESTDPRPLLLIVGDAWPVSQTGEDVIRETRSVLGNLKRTYPRLITMCLAVDGRYPPEDLYDYYVSLASKDMFQHFMAEFSKMIARVVLREVA